MSVLQAVFLGIVQGLTEFLPVSSSGHLAIFQNILHIETDSSVLFDVMLHGCLLEGHSQIDCGVLQDDR